jgi:ABC-type multidrug transport system fused ATPase/permease subunit
MTGGAGSRGLLALLPRIARYARPHRAPMGLGFGLSAVGIALDLAKPLPLAIVLDSILSSKPPPAILGPWFAHLDAMAQLGLAAAAIVLIAVCRGMTTLLANYLTIDVGQRMVNDLRTALYAHLQKLSLKFHSKHQSGDRGTMHRVVTPDLHVSRCEPERAAKPRRGHTRVMPRA